MPIFIIRDRPQAGEILLKNGVERRETKVDACSRRGLDEKKDRITHRIEITKLSDIDAEVKTWLKTAYERNA